MYIYIYHIYVYIYDIYVYIYIYICMRSANLAAKIHCKRRNKKALIIGELFTCKYVTLLQSYNRSTLSIDISTWLKTFSLPFLCPSYLDACLRLPSLADS